MTIRTTRAALAALLALAGCVSATAPSSPDAPPELAAVVRTLVVPPGSDCASGGTAVEAGLDRNRNGTLDDAEVTSTTYLCSAAREVLLLRADAEPAGANCAAGGVAVKAGLDANGNGLLDDVEVDKVRYQCGEAAPTPPPVLTRTAAEPAGVHCPAGGTRVDAGPDRDGSGALGDAEVERSLWICETAPGRVLTRTGSGPAEGCRGTASLVSAGVDADGDGLLSDGEVAGTTAVCSQVSYGFTVSSQADLDYLAANVRLVLGDLSVAGSDLATVRLPPLAVSGSLRVVDNPSLAEASLYPVALGGDLVVARNPALTVLSADVGFDRGASVLAGGLLVEDAPALEFVLSSLTRVGGDLVVRRTGLRYLGLDALQQVGGRFVLDDNDALTSASARKVGFIGGDLVLSGNDAMEVPFDWMTFIGRPNAEHAGDTTIGGEIVVSGNARLVFLGDVPAVTARGVRITGNPSLQGVDFFWLVAITGDWTISDNPVLGNFGSASDPLEVVTGSIRIERNPKLAATAGLYPIRTVGGEVLLSGAPDLEYFLMPSLVQADAVTIQDTGLRFLGPGTVLGEETLTRLEWASRVTLLRNPRLSDLQLPALRRLGALTVEDSPLLRDCQAAALAARVGAVATLAGNDAAGACP